MADITHGTWIKDGKAVDAVYQDGVKVYGRNLYTDTRDFDNPSVWINQSNWYRTGEKINGLTVTSMKGAWNGLSQPIQVKKGETYTFSVYARYQSGTDNSNIYFAPSNIKITSPGAIQVSLNEKWQRVTGTVTLTTDGSINPRIESYHDNTNVMFTAGLKLERGTTATPYSSAPEDAM